MITQLSEHISIRGFTDAAFAEMRATILGCFPPEVAA